MATAEPHKYRDLKILLVEDQADVRETMRNTLRSIGIDHIFEAENGSEAIEMLHSINDFADIIICDWNMPKTNGLDVLREVRISHPELPFLMVTGRDDIQSVREARDEGVTAYIRKPFSANEIEAKIRIMSSSSPF